MRAMILRAAAKIRCANELGEGYGRVIDGRRMDLHNALPRDGTCDAQLVC